MDTRDPYQSGNLHKLKLNSAPGGHLIMQLLDTTSSLCNALIVFLGGTN